MTTEHVATYHTRTGKVALKIDKTTRRDGTAFYSYTGKHGAGSGHPLEHVRHTVKLMLWSHPGIRLREGVDVLKASESHPS